MNERLARAETLFHEACELAPGEREAFLREACGEDADLLREVRALLRAAGIADQWLKDSDCAADGISLGSSTLDSISEGPGTVVGRYKLLEKIGEGGFGAVYMAEQEEPVHRKVALKIIKLGMDTRQVVARFEAERQALALMDHPHIAKVLDGGATDTGRPYFVMELVQGVPITRFCKENQLSTEERLKLFILVCHAIQHAHQKGIIHRDLKPTNVLVTLNDGVPHPMLIDFGVAKAINQRLTEKTLFTNFSQMIGTPAYMSPEQAEMSKLDVDTRSDIYSLGVLLYELLTGTTPFPEERLRSAGYVEMQKIICEEKPPLPSTRITRTAAPKLHSSLATHHSSLATDLDWIVMKCLEKDRTRRYETANSLAMDIERHLDNQPVLARPPSKLYEFQKTVRRHKVGFAAAAAIIVVLAAGVFVSAREAVRARRAEREQIRLRELAQEDAAKSKQVAQFLQDMIWGVAPSVALGRDTTLMREILDKTAKRVDKELTNQPEVEVDMLLTVADTYRRLGLYQQEYQKARESLRLARSLPGGEYGKVESSQELLVNALCGMGKLAEAEALGRKELAMVEKLHDDASTNVSDSPNDLALVGPPTVATSLNNLALVLYSRGKLAEAEGMFRKALAMYRKLYGDESPSVAMVLDNLASVLKERGQLAEAERRLRKSLAMRKKLNGDESTEVALRLNDLGWVLQARGKLAEAETLDREALAKSERLKYSAVVAKSRHNLADVLGAEGKWKEVASMVQREPTDPNLYHCLAPLLVERGDLEKYRSCCQEIIAHFGDTTDPTVGDQMAKDCCILPSSGTDLETVDRMAETAVNAGSNNWHFAYFLCTKGLVEYRQGHFTNAVKWESKTIDIGKHRGGHAWDDSLYVEADAVSAMAHFRLGQTNEAHAVLVQALQAATHLPKRGSAEFDEIWRDWIISHTLLDEAKALIEGKSASP